MEIMEIDDVTFRFEVIKIASKREHPTQGIRDILCDPMIPYNLVKEGKMSEVVTCCT